VADRGGPLAGIRVIELASIGPIPFCGMVLSDLGADILRVDRPADVATANPEQSGRNALERGRRSIGVDVKAPGGVDVVLRLVEEADIIIEGFRPGVAERLGIGPDECRARNQRLVYGRMTGWGRTGPLADRAGHDIDYIAIGGALGAIGARGGPPVPPINLVGDFGGGGLLLAFGLLAALVERASSGTGQVVDAAMVDGTAMQLAPFYAARQVGFWSDERGTNDLDGGRPWYRTYACADGGYVAVGAIEPKFYAALLVGLDLDARAIPSRDDPAQHDALHALFEERFRTRSRDEWAAHFADSDACVAPVLSLAEAPVHPHNVAREVFHEVEGVIQQAPAPRFDRTPGSIGPRCYPGQHTDEILRELGFDDARVAELRAAGAVL
jgi:alpha-methylacyl-CoA racemase